MKTRNLHGKPWRWRHSLAMGLLVRVGAAMFLPISLSVVWLWLDPRAADLLKHSIAWEMLVGFAVLLVGMFAEAVLAMRRRYDRMRRLLAALDALARGDLDTRLADPERDEIALAAQCVDRSVEGVHRILTDIAEHAHRLRTAAEGLTRHAATVTRHTAETAQQAVLLADSMVEVNSTLGDLLTGAEDVRASIDAIAERAACAGEAATAGVSAAATTQGSVARLESSSGEISGVVAFINAVAAQTNLLALNATIEAARAGEAGKGFAVVAGEVKSLAEQTEQATGSIDAQVAAIRQDASATVEALQGIGAAIEKVNTEQVRIGAAVDVQRDRTTEMTGRVNDTANTTLALTATIAELADAASRSTAGTREVADAVHSLANIAAGLDEITSRFTRTAHAGGLPGPAEAPTPDTGRAPAAGPVEAGEPVAVELF